MMIQLKNISFELPSNVVTNQQLEDENQDWDMGQVALRTGVHSRHIAAPDETALDLADVAAQKLFEEHPEAREDIDGLIFCTQSPDHIMPPNSTLMHQRLGLSDNVYSLDFTHACSGFVYGLAMVRGLIATGIAKKMLLINADTYSKLIHPHDRSTRTLFGDGAAVTLIEESTSTSGVIDILCGTNGQLADRFIVPAGGCRLPSSKDTRVPVTDHSGNIKTQENIHMDGLGILTFVNSRVPLQIRELLDRNDLNVDDIDKFIFHQASLVALESLANALKIPPEKNYSNLSEIGNTVGASIPIAIRQATESGQIKTGDLVVISGFGVGLSWASALIRI